MEVMKTAEKNGRIYVLKKEVECGLVNNDNAEKKWKSCSQVKKVMEDGSE